jgi:hypothetical protein
MLSVQVVLNFGEWFYEIQKSTIDPYKSFNYLYNNGIYVVHSNDSNIPVYKSLNS